MVKINHQVNLLQYRQVNHLLCLRQQQQKQQQKQQQGSTQPDRVGSHDEQTFPEGANQGGTVTDPTVNNGEPITANCFGKVIEHEAQEHKEDPDEGTLGEHSSDPVPEISGNETPRQCIGNQDQGHPAEHGAFNSQFEEEDAQNVADNC
ncbi:MAG TPA: hypothetical protein VFS97_04600 [Nitrososphaeraceae archaeon]|nr:hypothetical protein [Nitrososphaeraceae archaeon]